MDRSRPATGWLYVVLVGTIFLMAAPQGASAQPSSHHRGSGKDQRMVSLREAIATAITRNLRMADARLSLEEKERRRREAFSQFFPTIDLGYTAQWSRYRQGQNISALSGVHDSRWAFRGSPPPAFGIFPDYPYRIDPYRAFTMSATITQPLYTGGKYLNEYKFAQLGVDFSSLQLDVERQDLTLEVVEAYYQLVQSYKLLQVADESIRALEAFRNQTVEFYKAGVSAKVDVLSAEGQLAQARVQRTQSLTDIENNRALLNQLLRNPQDTQYPVDLDLSYVPNTYRLPDVYSVAAANRIEIRQANISIDQAMALVKSAKADLLPRVDVQARGVRFNDDWNTFDPEAVQDPSGWSLQGILSWSFNMFGFRETVQERRASQARAFVARQQVVEQIMKDVKQAYQNMKRSERDITDNRKAVEFRTENFRINKERYKEQVATYIEVLDAQRQLSLSEGDLYISQAGYRINQATLERQMGILR
ncbi:MAG: TolC family protein [Desulfomonile tiedjei]|nr:TolC family protein [Desulfomonile tiedjei]